MPSVSLLGQGAGSRTVGKATQNHSRPPFHSLTPQQSSRTTTDKMVNPLKDIFIGTGLGLIAGSVWNQWKEGELKRTTNFYKWYDAQQAKKATLSADDDDDDE